MIGEYWKQRWEAGHIGFHLAEVNPRLAAHHDVLTDCLRVLVPLCGKSVDLEWLAVQGHEVVGVELSEVAAQAFFAERGLSPERLERGHFVEYRHGLVTIIVGDFFATDRALLGACDGAYDRAAMIALPDELRRTYAQHLQTLLLPKARLLLLTLHYDAEGGPPFDVAAEEVLSAYAGARVTLLESSDARSEAPGPVSRGASFVLENVHLIELPEASH